MLMQFFREKLETHWLLSWKVCGEGLRWVLKGSKASENL
ncbi:hypothetical protein SLEP1_g56715 [Rubroshorea leprosula]|uniref:Uncharacterized protein n=1 Tax=Rubroshorea leprosula TaxID=152421 RepID=A0AAV5MKF5_9ROSI|nr:hypothetical protein SLEP1_g56715 [Rubroshorea leprosula]